MAAVIWRRRWLVFASALIGLVAAAVYLRAAVYLYTIELKVAPVQISGGGTGSRLGSLASLAGISMPKDQAVSPFQLYLENIQSRELADDIAARPDLMRRMFSGSWNASDQRWEEPTSTLSTIAHPIKRLLGIPVYTWAKPDSADVQEYIRDELLVIESPKKPVVTLRMQNSDPEFAKTFLQTLHRANDERLRRQTLMRTAQYIDYLSSQLRTVSIAEHREALAATLSEQEKQRMMASSRAPFAAEPVGEPTATPRPTNPRPVVVLVISVFVGLIVGLLGAILSEFVSRASRASAVAKA